MELTQNPSVLELVQKTAELTTPKEIVWICLLYTSDAADEL